MDAGAAGLCLFAIAGRCFMKRVYWMILVLALALAACGGKTAEKNVDLNVVYDSLVNTLPEMLVLDEAMQLNLLGVDSADCQQIITAICADSMRVDEVWLIQAKDAAALSRMKELAQIRIDSQAEVCESYAPDQYAIVKKAEVLNDGLYLALLIGPDAAGLRQTVAEAIR